MTLPTEHRSGEATARDERTAGGSAVRGLDAGPKRETCGPSLGRRLKHHIPVRTERWDVKGAGFVEVDLVSHCNSAKGEFAHRLNVTAVG